MQELYKSRKSQSICNKTVKSAKKKLKRLLSFEVLLVKLVELDSDKIHRYLDANMDEMKVKVVLDGLEEFSKRFKERGGNPDVFEHQVAIELFHNRNLIKDMLKVCK